MASASGDIVLLGAPEQEVIVSPLSQELLDDWKTNKSTYGHQHYMKHLLSTGRLADVAFIVKDEDGDDETAKFFVHKSILKCKTNLFFTTFCTEESSQAKEGLALEEIDLTSTKITSRVFKVFLESLYLEQVSLNVDNVMELYCYIAHKYQVNDLKTKCEDFLEANIDKENALKWFNAAMLHDISGVVLDALMSYICRHGKFFIEKSEFMELNQDNLAKVFTHERFRSSPMKLLRFCLCWTKKHFGVEKLSNSFAELDNLFRQALRISLDYHLPNLASLMSEVSPLKSKEVHEITRFQSKNVSKPWIYRRNRADRISFRASVPIMLTGIGLYGNRNSDPPDDKPDEIPVKHGKYDIDINVYVHGKSHKQVMHAYRRAGADMDTVTSIYNVNFNPRYLYPDEWYTLAVRIAGPPSYYGESGITEKLIRCGDMPVVIEFKEASSAEEAAKLSNATGVPIGQIPKLYFKLASPGDEKDDDVLVIPNSTT